MRMVDLGNRRGPIYIIDTPTSVDCTKDVRFRRTFRSLVECMVPYCCALQPTTSDSDDTNPITTTTHNATVVTGTFFGYRRGRVSFCLHADDSKSKSSTPSTLPLLLLDFAMPTSYLAREMQHGVLRIALVCHRSSASTPLYDVKNWSMLCNGRKVGFAVRRQVTEADASVFKLMKSVSAGAGVLPGDQSGPDSNDPIMYLRARFERVVGSRDSESFHMINPEGSVVSMEKILKPNDYVALTREKRQKAMN